MSSTDRIAPYFSASKYQTAAVPDRKLVHDDILSKGDKVLIRWTNSGTNTGPLFGNPPTGKTICRNRL